MPELTCYQCGTADTVSDKLGWLEIHYSGVPDWQRRFCGGTCLNKWSNAALERLTKAILGER